MNHTFEANAFAYWGRVILVVAMIFLFGLVPILIPNTSDPRGFILIIHGIGLVSLVVFICVRPRQLTLSIGESGVVIRNRSQRVLVARSLSEVSEVYLAKWGHVLKYPIGWIAILEAGKAKPKYVGAVSGCGLTEELIHDVQAALGRMKAK